MENTFMKGALCLVLYFGISLNAVSAEEWITEEVLKQLTEIRQEIKSLRGEVASLKTEVSNIQKVPSKATVALKTLDVKGAPKLGKDSSKYAIVEFSDFQCPYCKRHYTQTFPEIDKNYIQTGKIQYIAKQFPLDFHTKAKSASIAALCLEDQKEGLYWKGHSDIFSGSYSLDEAGYMKMASKHKINASSFKQCLTNPKKADIVDAEINAGRVLGVRGTPAFLIGKLEKGKLVDAQFVSGARPYSSFSRILDQLISQK